LDVLDVLVSTKDVEGVSVEHSSNPIEGSFAPAKLESGLFIIREGSIGGSEDVVQPRAAVQGSTVFGLRATMYEVGVDGSSFVWRLKIGRRRVVRRQGGGQKARQCLQRAS